MTSAFIFEEARASIWRSPLSPLTEGEYGRPWVAPRRWPGSPGEKKPDAETFTGTCLRWARAGGGLTRRASSFASRPKPWSCAAALVLDENAVRDWYRAFTSAPASHRPEGMARGASERAGRSVERVGYSSSGENRVAARRVRRRLDAPSGLNINGCHESGTGSQHLRGRKAVLRSGCIDYVSRCGATPILPMTDGSTLILPASGQSKGSDQPIGGYASV